MKKRSRLLCLVATVTFGLSLLLPTFVPSLVDAASSSLPDAVSGGVGIGVTLEGNGSTPASSYKVSGKNGSSTAIKFSYTNIGHGYPSSFIGVLGGAGSSCETNTSSDSSAREYNDVSLTVTLNGNTVGNGSIDLCDKTTGTVYFTDITVNNDASPSKPTTASIYGTITYSATQSSPAGAFEGGTSGNATGTLTDDTSSSSSNSQTINFDSSGNIVGTGGTGKYITGLTPGTYTLAASYSNASENIQVQTISYTFTLAAGQTLDVSKTIPASGDLTIGSPPSSNDSSGSTTPSCESTPGVFLGWLFCQIITGAASAADGIYSGLVQPLLKTNPIALSPSASDPTHTFAIWENFRVYGDIILVIALLVIVFGESIGGGLIDAYTAKKILPRILISAILINISIYIVAFAVDITNILGNGAGNLIELPFRSAGNHIADCSATANLGNTHTCFTLDISNVTGGLGLAALVGGIWAAVHILNGAVLEALLLFVVIPAVLTMIAIMATVLLRRGLIIFLILISPIAFALYCLPNTERHFRQWWDLLFRTLLIYPLIAVIFALANVLSVTIDSSTTGIDKTLADFMALAALVAPLFLIPYSFRIAGGLIGRFHEFATSARQRTHQGIMGSQQDPESWRNKAKGKVRMRAIEQGLTGQALATNVFPPTNPFTREGRAQWRQNREARRTADRTRSGQRYMEADSVFQANKGNDQYLLALANPRLAEAKRAAAVSDTERAAWDAAMGAARITHSSPATRLQAANTLASTGFQFSAGQRGYEELASTIADITGAQLGRDGNGNLVATGGNIGTYNSAMDFAQYSARQGGRFDLGGINHGAGYNYRAGIGRATGYTSGQGQIQTYQAGAESYLGVQLGTPNNADETPDEGAISQQLLANITGGRTPVDDVLAWHGKLLEAEPGAKGGNQDEIRKQLRAIRGAASALNAGPTPGNEAQLEAFTRLSAGIERQERQQRRSGVDPNLLEDQ